MSDTEKDNIIENSETVEEEPIEEPKKKRGRPRKTPVEEEEESVIKPVDVINVPERKKRAVTEKRKEQLALARKAKKEQSIAKAKQLRDASDEHKITKPIKHYLDYDVYDDDDDDEGGYLNLRTLFKVIGAGAILLAGITYFWPDSKVSTSSKEVIKKVTKTEVTEEIVDIPTGTVLYNFE